MYPYKMNLCGMLEEGTIARAIMRLIARGSQVLDQKRSRCSDLLLLDGNYDFMLALSNAFDYF